MNRVSTHSIKFSKKHIIPSYSGNIPRTTKDSSWPMKKFRGYDFMWALGLLSILLNATKCFFNYPKTT